MSETRHHLRSVSDLYAADEIEVLLLEEIRDLEPPPTAYSRPEDIQDFEIAGSRTGGAISSQSSELDSPGVHSTVHSWDSHANYHGHYGHGDHRHGSSTNVLPWPRASHLILYCDIQGHLKTATGVVRILLLITSVACLATLCSSGTANVSLFMLPLVERLRFIIFVAVFSLLITTLLLFLDISHVVYMFPLNWAKLNFWIFSGIGVFYIAGCGILGLTIWEYHGSGWVPRRTRSQLTAAAGLALSCGFIAFILSYLHGRTGISCKAPSSHEHSQSQLYKPVDSSSSGLTLKDKSPKQPPAWVVRNQKSKKNPDTESNTTSKGNGNCEKYKPGVKKKDHWASARQHFLSQDDDEIQTTIQRDESDLERKRHRRRRDDSGSSGGNGVTATANRKLTGAGTSGETNKVRRVPQKLPLKTIERPQPRRSSTAKSQQTSVKTSRTNTNNDLQSYVAATVKAWELEAGNDSERAEALKVSLLQASTWSEKWQPPDDVQPCSSKTIDPYTFG
ncbi:hypothetical protein PV325_005423 [Microctonus aethiopoides]|uniref:MARVEL domain-containing protein n=1 Tax=Microctonus aethiopoides TaxID=144406 RepID=A0AA39FP69_9HYME|nr:hypothetical protein PV325_005423 [Microctonus aethiopoides]KAK0098409.1 hypothetical protein PV326_008684 [Microctonus aethiopoides]KAK0173133.1 hypothetical protein PV328_006376 [Microctonus aethiopoides]